MVTLKVLKKFQDKDNKEKIYQVGETLSTEGNKPEKISLFDKEFEIGAVKGALAEIGVSINKNAGVQAITNKLGELTEEQNKALSEILCKE